MSEHSSRHRLRRTMSDMTVGVLEQQEGHDADFYPVVAGDQIQHVQVRLHGYANRSPVYTESDVFWPNPFLMRVAPTQFDGSLKNPHFNYGVELLTDEHLMITAQVRKWLNDDSSLVIGARVRFSAWSPEAPKVHKYSAIAHLTFSGYAAPSESADTDDE